MVELNENAKEHDRIWLEPAGAPDRCWCEDNQWGEDGVEYVRVSSLPATDDGLAERLRNVSNMINMGEGIRWGEETALMDQAATALQSKDEQIERLTRERDEVSSSLEYLLVGYVGRYCDPVPEWQPLPTLGGIISQLDNAMTVTTTFKDRAEAAEQQVQKLTAENERLRKAVKQIERRTAPHDDDTPADDKRDKMHANAIARSALETQEGGK